MLATSSSSSSAWTGKEPASSVTHPAAVALGIADHMLRKWAMYEEREQLWSKLQTITLALGPEVSWEVPARLRLVAAVVQVNSKLGDSSENAQVSMAALRRWIDKVEHQRRNDRLDALGLLGELASHAENKDAPETVETYAARKTLEMEVANAARIVSAHLDMASVEGRLIRAIHTKDFEVILPLVNELELLWKFLHIPVVGETFCQPKSQAEACQFASPCVPECETVDHQSFCDREEGHISSLQEAEGCWCHRVPASMPESDDDTLELLTAWSAEEDGREEISAAQTSQATDTREIRAPAEQTLQATCTRPRITGASVRLAIDDPPPNKRQKLPAKVPPSPSPASRQIVPFHGRRGGRADIFNDDVSQFSPTQSPAVGRTGLPPAVGRTGLFDGEVRTCPQDSRWTTEEEDKLINAYRAYGSRWEFIRTQCQLQHRTGVQLRWKWRNLVKAGRI